MSKKYTTITIYSDGGARGNPGPAGIGFVLYDDKKEIIEEGSRYIGETTNNQAEYKALIAGLESAKEYNPETVHCYLDSELVVKQCNKEYKVKDEGLQQLFIKVWNAMQSFKKVTFTHVRREKNKEADKLVNVAIDRHVK